MFADIVDDFVNLVDYVRFNNKLVNFEVTIFKHADSLNSVVLNYHIVYNVILKYMTIQ